MTAIRRRIVPIRLSEDEYETIWKNALAAGYQHPEGARLTGPNIAAFLRESGLKRRGKKHE